MISVAFNQLIVFTIVLLSISQFIMFMISTKRRIRLPFCRRADTVIGQSCTVLGENAFEPGKESPAGRMSSILVLSSYDMMIRYRMTLRNRYVPSPKTISISSRGTPLVSGYTFKAIAVSINNNKNKCRDVLKYTGDKHELARTQEESRETRTNQEKNYKHKRKNA